MYGYPPLSLLQLLQSCLTQDCKIIVVLYCDNKLSFRNEPYFRFFFVQFVFHKDEGSFILLRAIFDKVHPHIYIYGALDGMPSPNNFVHIYHDVSPRYDWLLALKISFATFCILKQEKILVVASPPVLGVYAIKISYFSRFVNPLWYFSVIYIFGFPELLNTINM